MTDPAFSEEFRGREWGIKYESVAMCRSIHDTFTASARDGAGLILWHRPRQVYPEWDSHSTVLRGQTWGLGQDGCGHRNLGCGLVIVKTKIDLQFVIEVQMLICLQQVGGSL